MTDPVQAVAEHEYWIRLSECASNYLAANSGLVVTIDDSRPAMKGDHDCDCSSLGACFATCSSIFTSWQ